MRKDVWKKGYRVVSVTYDGEYVSCTRGGRRITYPPCSTAKRPLLCGPLSVFTSVQAAREFAKELDFFRWFLLPLCPIVMTPSRLVVVRCKYLQSKDSALWCWKDGRRVTTTDVPLGTDFADRVVTLAPSWRKSSRDDFVPIWLPWEGMVQVVFK